MCLILNSCNIKSNQIGGQQIKSDSKFFQEYPKLKEQEAWPKIINLGLQSINTGNLTPEEQAVVNLRLASCYHYIGKFEMAAKIAENARKYLESSDNIDLLGRSYYLLSASYRSISLKAPSPDKQKKFTKIAHEWIDRALTLTDNSKVKNFTKAKIYFNAGALEQDVDHNNKKACEYYLKAMKIFAEEPHAKDDYDRTAIRYLRSQLELGNLNAAELKAKELAKTIDLDSKTGVHLLQLQSKISFQKDTFHESYNYVEQALDIALRKGLKTDIDRLEILKQTIIKKEPTVQSSSLKLQSSLKTSGMAK